MSARTLAACMVALLLACGCAAPRPQVRTVWLGAWGFGAFGGGSLDVRRLCPSGTAQELALGSTWATLGVSLATLGVYTPREVKVRCVPLR